MTRAAARPGRYLSRRLCLRLALLTAWLALGPIPPAHADPLPAPALAFDYGRGDPHRSNAQVAVAAEAPKPQAVAPSQAPSAMLRGGEGSLNPGDVIALILPGEASFDQPRAIDAEGKINVPEIGKVAAAGKSVTALRDELRTRLATYFRDLDRFDLRLTERRLLISVSGYVRKAGRYDLAANATVEDAITAAGGLMQGAQLDRLQLRRAGEVSPFDYKRYLDSGDLALLPRLRPLDEIFVPSSPLTGNVQIEFDATTLKAAGDAAEDGSAVRAFGEVRNPGRFAWRDGMSAVDVIMRAGGVTQFANVEQIRVIVDGEPVIFNLKNFLDTGDQRALPKVAPGGTVFVPRETGAIKSGSQIVYVMGEVAKPGAFETAGSLNFLDILANAGGPTRFADTRQIKIMRANGRVEAIDMTKATATGRASLPKVGPGDAILVPEKKDQNQPSWLEVSPDRAIYVMGAVARPGRYEWSGEMSLLDLLAHAGGPTDRADVAAIKLVPPVRDGTAAQAPITLDLDAVMEGRGTSRLPKVGAGWTIIVPDLPDDPTDNKARWMRQAGDRSIYVMGAVNAPGRYAFDRVFHFLDILSAADGPSSDADLRAVRVTRRSPVGTRTVAVDLASYFVSGDDRVLPRVEPGDVIYVPHRTAREWLDLPKEQSVRVLGAVAKPGRYRFDESMTVLDLLAEAGGPTASAYQERIVVVNLSCCEDQARTFDLVGFARSGDITRLPLVRAGDTIYVPDQSQSEWKLFMDGVRDAVQIFSVLALAGVL